MEDLFKGLKRTKKRMTLAVNVTKGRIGEASYETGRRAQGYTVKRKAHGSDYEEQYNPIIGRKGRGRLVEIKTGGANLSNLQQKTKERNRRNYRVIRY